MHEQWLWIYGVLKGDKKGRALSMKCAVNVFSQYLGLAFVSKIIYQRPLSAEDLLALGVSLLIINIVVELLKEVWNARCL
jgi:hypothetical protein